MNGGRDFAAAAGTPGRAGRRNAVGARRGGVARETIPAESEEETLPRVPPRDRRYGEPMINRFRSTHELCEWAGESVAFEPRRGEDALPRRALPSPPSRAAAQEEFTLTGLAKGGPRGEKGTSLRTCGESADVECAICATGNVTKISDYLIYTRIQSTV